jgi:hypothetical protein
LTGVVWGAIIAPHTKLHPKIAPQPKPLIYIFFFFFGVQKGNKIYKIEIERALIIYNALQCIDIQIIMCLAKKEFCFNPTLLHPTPKGVKNVMEPGDTAPLFSVRSCDRASLLETEAPGQEL